MISIHALREEGDGWQRLDGFVIGISIHALREEGDPAALQGLDRQQIFLSTPSARRATNRVNHDSRKIQNFYPRPPRGGRHAAGKEGKLANLFLSTPSARRATFDHTVQHFIRDISIHALREEGDQCASKF